MLCCFKAGAGWQGIEDIAFDGLVPKCSTQKNDEALREGFLFSAVH